MRFGKRVDGSEKNRLNFENDPEHILYIVDVVN